jgi:predicted flap endonuclease-1-like 5' DNA nuclease
MTAFAIEVALLLTLVFAAALAVGYRLGRKHRPAEPVQAEVLPTPTPAVVERPPVPAVPEPQPEPPVLVEPAPSPQRDLFARLGIADMNAVPPLDEEEEDEPPRSTPASARPAPRTRRRPPESLPGVRPPALDAPEGEGADDLKQLKGIGPQNEQRLNEIGIFHLRQIAAWTPEEAAWVGSYLAFPGRIEREDWMGQAKAILEGGAPPPRRRR